MAKTTVPRKPLIWADDPLDNERYDDAAMRAERFDGSYVPLYSEARIENELRIKKGLPPKPLPKLQWVRGSNREGEDVTIADEGMMEWRRLGYRACGLDDLESMGFGFPPTAHVAPDGTIRRQDSILFFVDAERAERNRRVREREREELRATKDIERPEGLEVYQETNASGQGRSLEEIESLDLPTLGKD